MKGKQNALASHTSDAVLTSEFLLEYLEGEIEDVLDFDLELLLTDSVADWCELQSLQATKELLKSTDEICLPEDGHYYERLHAAIMQAVMAEAAIETSMESETNASKVKPQGEFTPSAQNSKRT